MRGDRLLWLIVGVGAAIRFATLTSQGFWFDEYLAVDIVTRDPGEMLPRIEVAETNPPLYFVLAAGWERVFGSGELALRSLSALIGTATIPVVFAAAAALANRRAALIAAALTAASPLMIWYSQEARPYALLALLAALSFLCFVHLLEDRGSRWLWAWAIVSILAIGTHYFGGLLFVLEAAVLLWRRPATRAETGLAIGAVATAGLTLVPLAAAQSGLTSWIGELDLADRLLRVPEHFLVGMSAPWELIAPLAAAIVAAAVIYALVRVSEPELAAVKLAGGLALGGLLIVVVAAAAGQDYITSRNLIELWVPFAIALAVLLAAPALRGAGPAIAGGLCLAGLALAIWTAATPTAARPDWDDLAAGLGPPEGERAIIADSPLIAPLSLYLDGARVTDTGEVTSAAELDVVELRPVDERGIGPCWWLGFCGGRNLVGATELPWEVPPEFELVDEGSTELFDYRRYRAPAPVELPPAGFGGTIVQPPQT